MKISSTAVAVPSLRLSKML
jgi:hypothetical protein